ncbi:MAG: tetratricopeptide repeat protein, partial [Lachnospiraceae bacterium]|nr:tetratricopeptide repeat protein [Lachnospiraceae bacterium]
MEKQMIFHILNMDETKDEDKIKEAYLTLLKQTNPEDDPEGFKRLREAYEAGIAFTRTPEIEDEEEEQTEISIWIDKINAIYLDIYTRCDIEEWEELLEDPVCNDLDTCFDARDAFLVWMMNNHIYLPNKIYFILDEKFQIREDREELAEKFPENFLNYIIYYIEHEEFLCYDLFQVTNKSAMNVDAYIRAYFELKDAVEEGQYEGIEQKLEDMKAFGVYMPFEDVEKMRFLLETEHKEKSLDIAEQLFADFSDNIYIKYWCGIVFLENGQTERANILWEQVLEEVPDHYGAKVRKIYYLVEKKEYEKAKKLIFDILRINGEDKKMIALLHRINKTIIEEYEEKLKGTYETEEERFKDELELGWCLFQNEHEEEVLSLLKGKQPEKDSKLEYTWFNLMSRVYYEIDCFEEAYPLFKRLLELIQNMPEDGREETKEQKAKEGQVYQMSSCCAYNIEEQEQALSYIKMAQAFAQKNNNIQELLEYLDYEAWLLLQYEEYEKCIEICEKILEKNDRYFSAYQFRQEAAFHLGKAQMVVNDFYNAIDIFSGYYKPYLLAVQVFFDYDQHEDAKGVIERAKANEVEFSPKLKLYEVKVLRNLAETKEDREPIFTLAEEILEEISRESNQESCDIEDKSEVRYEIALLHWDNNDYNPALKALNVAIKENPKRMQYRLIRGYIYQDKKQFKKALKEYYITEKKYWDYPNLYYNIGICHEQLDNMKDAILNYEKALSLEEGFRDTCERLFQYYKKQYGKTYKKDDFEKALEYINRQLACTENCYYLVERGRLYMMAFELKEAIADYEKALTYVSDDWAAHNNLGCCYKY